MIILILIDIAVMLYIYFKYYKFPETIKENTTDIKDKNSMLIGYIYDKGTNNNFDLILAEIIELNIKGYVIIEYDTKGIDKYNYIIKQNIDISANELNKEEMLILNFLFPIKMEITKNELEEKLNNTFLSYNTQFNEIGEILNNQLVKENIIDVNKKKKLTKKSKQYILISIVSILLVSILGIINILNVTSLYMLIYILEKVVSSVLLIKASVYTDKGQKLKYEIDSYKIKLEKEEFLMNNNTMKDIVLKKEFANSIALHIKTQAKEAFIDDNMTKEATKISKNTIMNVGIGLAIIILIALILSKITLLLPRGLVFWLYLGIALAVACVADITLYKKK